MMKGGNPVLVEPWDGSWINVQPAVRCVDPKLGWVNVFWGGDRWKGCGLEGGISTPGFSHPENGYILGFFLNLASGGDLDSIHVQRFYVFKGCIGCQGIQWMSRDSPEVTD